MSYRIINGQAYSVGNIGQVDDGTQTKLNNTTSVKDKTSFKQVLDSVKSKDQGFTVSKHAALRLNEINFHHYINFSFIDAGAKTFKSDEFVKSEKFKNVLTTSDLPCFCPAPR